MKRIIILFFVFLVSVLPEAQARRWTPKPVASSGPVTFSYKTLVVSATDSNTYSFSGLSIGAEADRSHVIVGFVGRRTGTTDTTSVTIGGVTATRIYQFQGADGVVCFYGAVVPTGTTATVDVTLDNTTARAALALWTAKNLSSLTPVNTNSNQGSSSTSLSLNTTTPSGDSFVLAFAYISFGGAQTITWSGLTENAQLPVEAVAEVTPASAAFSSSGSQSISASWGNASLVFSASCSLQ